MAFRARLAALYRSGWPFVFRQSVWRREWLGSARAFYRPYVGQNLEVWERVLLGPTSMATAHKMSSGAKPGKEIWYYTYLPSWGIAV